MKQIAKIAESAKIGNLKEVHRRKVTKRTSATRYKTAITPSSGNVFADLQLTDADEKQTKVRLAVTINGIIKQGNLSRTATSEILQVSRASALAIDHYQLERFSVERLIVFLNAICSSVEAQGPSPLLAR